jgi:beta-glucosidase
MAPFPRNFLWGASSSAHQVEGNNTNNDSWLLEHVPESRFRCPSGDAVDHFHRYPADIGLLASLGLNSYRFSIEWSRIEPEEGCFSVAALDHYRRMLAACREHRIRSVVTFHHFTSPKWLLRRGGWEGEGTPDRFARFCERATKHLGDLIDVGCTINEANFAWLVYRAGGHPVHDEMRKFPWWDHGARAVGVPAEEFAPFTFTGTERATQTILRAHRQATAAIKGTGAAFPLGATLLLQDIQAGPGGEKLADQMRAEINDRYLDALVGDDFVGVQNYGRTCFDAHGPMRPQDGAELSEIGLEVFPEGLEAAIRNAVSVAKTPVLVTENGLATQDDAKRVAFMRDAIRAIERCLASGVDVRGYLHWSILDNFEWTFGFGPSMGLVAVDRDTQARTPKPSAHWLGRVARANALVEE